MDKIKFIANIALTGNVTEENIEAYLEHALDELQDQLEQTDGDKWLDVYEVSVTRREQNAE